jgi:hypothetical protein
VKSFQKNTIKVLIIVEVLLVPVFLVAAMTQEIQVAVEILEVPAARVVEAAAVVK